MGTGAFAFTISVPALLFPMPGARFIATIAEELSAAELPEEESPALSRLCSSGPS